VNSFWQFFWLLVWWFFFVAYLMVLFQIIADVFRDRKLSGFAKAMWIIFLIIVPVLVALIYLIARGSGMAERHLEAATEARQASDAYIRSVARPSGASSAADQIAKAKELLDSGVITQADFDQLKAKALA
jgi:Short C-terminal domain